MNSISKRRKLKIMRKKEIRKRKRDEKIERKPHSNPLEDV
jgi:hypothetical protein